MLPDKKPEPEPLFARFDAWAAELADRAHKQFQLRVEVPAEVWPTLRHEFQRPYHPKPNEFYISRWWGGVWFKRSDTSGGGTVELKPEADLAAVCTCCCTAPATHRAVLRSVTWERLCDDCLRRVDDPASYVPPDGEILTPHACCLNREEPKP